MWLFLLNLPYNTGGHMLTNKYRMKKSKEFRQVFTSGKSYSSRHVVIYVFNNLTPNYGFIASKKIGNAVKRNRAKRLIREAVRLNLTRIDQNYRIIFIARNSINGANYKEVEKSVLYLLKKAGVLQEF